MSATLTEQPAFLQSVTREAVSIEKKTGRRMVIALVILIMLVPIRLYRLPISIGFAAEPYRLLFVLIGVSVMLAALANPAWKLPRLFYGRQVAALIGMAIFSLGCNASHIAAEGNSGLVVGNLINWAVFVGVFLLIRMLIRTREDIHALLGSLVFCGGIVGVAAAYERQSSYNVFDHLASWIPFLHLIQSRTEIVRDGGVRATASAQHPIALGALLVMLLPLALWMMTHGEWPRRSWRPAYVVSFLAIAAGVAASASRTSVVMFAVSLLVIAMLRPAMTWSKIVPMLAVGLVVVQFVLVPGAVTATLQEFNPQGGLVAQQTGQPGTTGSGRLGDLVTVSDQAQHHPLTGIGFGSRVFTGDRLNAFILDDEYLDRVVEEGLPGLIVLCWLLWSPVRRSWKMARQGHDAIADLHTALTCLFAAYAVSLFTFDGFSFFQVTLVFFMLLAVSAWGLDHDKSKRDATRVWNMAELSSGGGYNSQVIRDAART